MHERYLYIFLDESGNMDFSENGTRYFSLSSIAKERPFHAFKKLTEVKYDLVEKGVDIEYFHASEDAQETRDRVFAVIRRHLAEVRVDTLVVEKRLVEVSRRKEERFYPEMLGILLGHVLATEDLNQFTEVIVFTDRLPIQRKRSAVEKAVKLTLTRILPSGVRYRVLHHDSKSNLDLQIADYINWAIYRKWDRKDARSYDLVKSAVRDEVLFQSEAGSQTI